MAGNLIDVDWDAVEEQEARSNTQWEFIPVASQWKNARAERSVKTLKRVLQTILATTLDPDHKCDYNYSEFQGVIRKITTIANDRPIDLKAVM